jgi:hypothetical protein
MTSSRPIKNISIFLLSPCDRGSDVIGGDVDDYANN